MKKQILVLSVVILFFLTLSSSYAGVPMDTVQVHVDKVLKVLGDPKLKSPSAKEIKKEKLRIIFDEMFDKIELSRRTLGRNWNNLTSAQRAEFVDLFKQILEKIMPINCWNIPMKRFNFIKKMSFLIIRRKFKVKLLLPPRKFLFFTA